LGALAYWIDATFFLIALLFARIDTQARYYTRNAEIAWLIAVKGGRVWHEAHNWPNSKTALFCFFLKKTSGIITNSQGTRDAYVSHGFPHVTVIQNGVDIEKFALDDSSHEARRARDLPLHVPLVMYVGSFARWKGVATVIAAWKRVKEGHPDAQLVLIGGTVEALKKFPECTDDILSARVIVRAHQSSALIPLYLRAADILLLPNEPVSEEAIRFTSPIKLFEYMASGRPIIASNLPSMREILNDTNAVLFTAGDAKELSSAILSLLADNRKKESCARSARADVEEFSWTNRAKRIMDTIDFH
jgi:glycosyltransferase involved in cell wall biosynthesis